MSEESILHAVTPQYDFQVLGWRWIRPDSCRLETDRGRKILVLHESETQAVLEGQLLDLLAAHRIRRIPRYIRTRYGDPMVRTRLCVCTVADDWEGDPLRYTIADSIDASINLAHIHRAFTTMSNASLRFPQSSSTCEQLTKDGALLQEIAAECSGNERNPFARLYAQYAHVVCTRARTTLATLRDSGWEMHEEGCINAQHLCFGPYDLAKLSRTETGRIATLDVSTVHIGDPDKDLYGFCRTLHAHGCTQYLPEVLNAYDGVVGADSTRTSRAVSFSGFPHATVRAALRYQRSAHKDTEQHAVALARALYEDGCMPRELFGAGGALHGH